MDKLKDFIGQNRELFDQTELPSGHKARFLEKLATADLPAENGSPAAYCSISAIRQSANSARNSLPVLPWERR